MARSGPRRASRSAFRRSSSSRTSSGSSGLGPPGPQLIQPRGASLTGKSSTYRAAPTRSTTAAGARGSLGFAGSRGENDRNFQDAVGQWWTGSAGSLESKPTEHPGGPDPLPTSTTNQLAVTPPVPAPFGRWWLPGGLTKTAHTGCSMPVNVTSPAPTIVASGPSLHEPLASEIAEASESAGDGEAGASIIRRGQKTAHSPTAMHPNRSLLAWIHRSAT